jgi:hypothetical protein
MNTTTIFLYLVFACLGAAVGALIQRVQNRKDTPPPPPDKDKLAGEGDVEVLSAWRTRGNQVWLEMDGVRLDNKDALRADQYQRLLGLVLDLRPWLEKGHPAAPETNAAPRPSQPQPSALAGRLEQKKGKPAEAEAKPAVVLKSIIEQIDEVLQTKLQNSVFKDRGIQLVEGSGGAVIVKDGVNRYEGVDAVPDPEVQALIRQAVADWEKSSQ